MGEPKHCDDYIRDKAQPKALRKFLLYHRIPAVWQYTKWRWPVPTLHATWGKVRVKVTMASRFGDVGITWDLNQRSGYMERVAVAELRDFSEAE